MIFAKKDENTPRSGEKFRLMKAFSTFSAISTTSNDDYDCLFAVLNAKKIKEKRKYTVLMAKYFFFTITPNR